MSRKPRLQFQGAIYHIISRGNYRKELFKVYRSGEQFEKAIFETCERCGWMLHAYVIMGNLYGMFPNN